MRFQRLLNMFPKISVTAMSKWKASRIDIIGQNGGTGEHYSYPTQVCFDCGVEAMSPTDKLDETYDWFIGPCQICDLHGGLVTSPFYFGCPDFGGEDDE